MKRAEELWTQHSQVCRSDTLEDEEVSSWQMVFYFCCRKKHIQQKTIDEPARQALRERKQEILSLA